jgi:hypothetical protein
LRIDCLLRAELHARRPNCMHGAGKISLKKTDPTSMQRQAVELTRPHTPPGHPNSQNVFCGLCVRGRANTRHWLMFGGMISPTLRGG